MLDFDILARSYFWFDLPVPYKINKEQEIQIYPIKVQDSEKFLSWIDILSIDKNSLPDATYISMSYLEFLFTVFIQSPQAKISQASILKLSSILKVCLKMEGNISIQFNVNHKPYLIYKDIVINGQQFEDIRRIILYQNLIDFDDSYINPDVKEAIDEVERVKNRNIEAPNLERRMAIITAHCGLSKETQMAMTYRSHSVYGEVDYTTIRTPILIGNMFSKQKVEIDDWIYKKKQGKYEKYFTDIDTYQHSMGGQGAIQTKMISVNDSNNFNGLIK